MAASALLRGAISYSRLIPRFLRFASATWGLVKFTPTGCSLFLKRWDDGGGAHRRGDNLYITLNPRPLRIAFRVASMTLTLQV